MLCCGVPAIHKLSHKYTMTENYEIYLMLMCMYCKVTTRPDQIDLLLLLLGFASPTLLNLKNLNAYTQWRPLTKYHETLTFMHLSM